MKCKYCHGVLSLEQEVCPYCGRPNEEAAQHARDMKKYQRRFKATQSDVYEVTRKNSEITAYTVIVMLLVILCVIVFTIAGHSYSIYADFKRADADRHAEAYTAQLKQYLEDEEYLNAAAFCSAHYIRSYSDSYEAYAPVLTMAEYYQYLYSQLMDLITTEYESSFTYGIESLANYYDGIERAREQLEDPGVDVEFCSRMIDRMELEIDFLIRTYMGMSQEEIENFKDGNRVTRMMLLAQKYEEMGYADKLEK